MLDDAREETVSQTGNGEPGTKEAEALAAALNHSAERVQTLWFSFLTFMLYLAIATGTTTHRMLFREDPLNLPVLNIPSPLVAFYILTPVIFVVFHFYMLLNLVLLARTARTFEDALGRAMPEDGEARETFRMRIENTLFVQLLVGGRLEREGINAKLLSAMALISLALAPVLLLLMFEVKFLPYHSWQITWLHRSLLFVDIALVWTLWPGYRRQGGERLWPKRSWWLVPAGAFSAAALAYAVVVATFPDERIYVATYWLHGSTYFDPNTGKLSSRDRPDWYALMEPVNTLDLHREDFIDDVKLALNIEKNENSADTERWVASLSFAGRDLTGADLTDADVRHVEFSGAILNRASLSSARAEKAHFDCVVHQDASRACAQLQGAFLKEAQLQGGSLQKAELQGASLKGVQLQGALLDGAQLLGASLQKAELQGASLKGVKLQGASLTDADLRGASLQKAELQGASLFAAQLQGALLDGAQLQGASLDNTKLQSASLAGAQLQCADLNAAGLQGASFLNVCAWRADARYAFWTSTRVVQPATKSKANLSQQCDWTETSFVALKQLIAAEVPEGNNKRDAMKRIEQCLDPDPTKPLKGEDEMATDWAAHEHEPLAPGVDSAHVLAWDVWARGLARRWRELGCVAKGAPYVLHGLVAQLSSPDTPFPPGDDVAKALAAEFRDEARCPGAHGLSVADKAKLKKIAPPAAPQAPKP